MGERYINGLPPKPGFGEVITLPPEASADYIIARPPLPEGPDGYADMDALVRCPETWDFGRTIGKVQCSFSDGHHGFHYAAGNNPFGIHYKWGEVKLERGTNAEDEA